MPVTITPLVRQMLFNDKNFIRLSDLGHYSSSGTELLFESSNPRRRGGGDDWGRRIAGWSPRERPLPWFVANVLATGASLMLLIECGVAQATQRRCVAPTATAFYLIWAALLTALWCTQLIVERVHACTSTATNNNSNDNNNISHEDTTSLQVPPPPTPTHGTRWRCDRLSSYHGMVELRDHFPRSVETVMAAAFLLYAWLALWRWDLSRHGLDRKSVV